MRTGIYSFIDFEGFAVPPLATGKGHVDAACRSGMCDWCPACLLGMAWVEEGQ